MISGNLGDDQYPQNPLYFVIEQIDSYVKDFSDDCQNADQTVGFLQQSYSIYSTYV